jgi:hypothetical protein
LGCQPVEGAVLEGRGSSWAIPGATGQRPVGLRMGADRDKPIAQGKQGTVRDTAPARQDELRALAEEPGPYPDELAYMLTRDEVSDEALVARMNAAPDMGGATLVELSRFLARRAERDKG